MPNQSPSQITASSIDLLNQGRKAEADGLLQDAAKFYEQVIKQQKFDEFPYDRLMIVYRKLKQYKDELRVIDNGIRAFEKQHKKPARKTNAKQQQVEALSNAFLKTAGLKDKKGNLVYIPEPMSRWMKRRSVVQRKMK